MRKIISGILVLVFVITAMLITTTVLAKSNNKHSKALEYKFLTGKEPGHPGIENGVYEEDINQLAQEGWRVVQADNLTTFCAEGKDLCKIGYVLVLMERKDR